MVTHDFMIWRSLIILYCLRISIASALVCMVKKITTLAKYWMRRKNVLRRHCQDGNNIAPIRDTDCVLQLVIKA